MYTKKQRIISFIACIAFILVAFCSALFIVKAANHFCTGDNCPICAAVEIAEDTMENTDTTESSEETAESESTEIMSDSSESGAENLSENGDVDYDLTSMNSDMVYATVYQMMVEPDSYLGMTVKMNGQFATVLDEFNGNRYYACIIQDALACCAQGFEFVWDDGSHVYPDEYPADGAEITVQGIFNTYEENGYTYCQLKDAEMTAD